MSNLVIPAFLLSLIITTGCDHANEKAASQKHVGIIFPDLTVDGSFTLGAAVLAKLLSSGQSVYFSLVAAAASGFLAGAASLNRYLGISKILSGILIMLILYSINLRVNTPPA